MLLPTVDRARVRERLTPPMPTDVLWGWLGPLLITAVAGVLRFWDLGRPKAFIFDETYYAKDAWSLLHFGVEQDYIHRPTRATPTRPTPRSWPATCTASGPATRPTSCTRRAASG